MEEIVVKTISVKDAKEKLDKGEAVFVDVRDPASYDEAHIPGALLVNDSNVGAFIANTDKTRTHIVYCYHGINSKDAARYFDNLGYKNVYSLDGGFSEYSKQDH